MLCVRILSTQTPGSSDSRSFSGPWTMCKLPLPSEVVIGKVPWIRPDPLPHSTQAQYLVWPTLRKNRAPMAPTGGGHGSHGPNRETANCVDG